MIYLELENYIFGIILKRNRNYDLFNDRHK